MTKASPDAVPAHLQSRISSLRAKARTSGHKIIGIGLLVAVALTAVGFWLLDFRRAQRDREALLRVAVPAATSLLQRLRSNLEVLRGTGAFVSATDKALNADRFRAFTQPLLDRHPSVYALEWAPEVLREDREAFEASVRAAGLAEFTISQPSRGAGLRPVTERTEYFPILYEEPHGGALGLDVAFEEVRRSLVREALKSGEIVVSAPFELAERESREEFVAAYMPVVDPAGLAILVLETTSLFQKWSRDIEDPRVRVWVLGREQEDGQLVFGEPQPIETERQWEETLPLGNGSIRVGFSVPWGYGGGGFVVTGGSLFILFLGLAGTGVAWGLDRERWLEAQVERAKELGQYVIEKKLGQGAMGVVFLARHALMKRPTALKLMLSQDAKSIERFEREVRLSCQLSHPNIVALYDFGRTEDGIFYYAMEYLPGIDLHTLVVREGPVSDGRAVHFLVQLALGLKEAHAAGLVHRDIKPGNLLLTRIGTRPDVLKILDFGLVKPVEDPAAPDAGRIVGTPLFMAPESIQTPDEVGPATDIYAVGCIAFHLLSGRPPFVGPNVRALLNSHLEDQPPSLTSRAVRTVSVELDQLVAECLDKDPKRRPTDDELVHRLYTMSVEERWSDWDAAQWWANREAAQAQPAGETTSLHEVTVLARRDARD